MIKKILLLLLLSFLLPSSFRNDVPFTLNLIFKEINVKTGDKVFYEDSKNIVGSVVSNKKSNHYNIVKIKLSNEIKIPINSIFEHILTGSLMKNAINISPVNGIGSYKNEDIIIVDFKGIVTICDRVDSVKVIFDKLNIELEESRNEFNVINQNVNLKTKDYWEIDSEIKILSKVYERIDSMVFHKTEAKEKELRKLGLKVSSLKIDKDSLEEKIINMTNKFNNYTIEIEDLLELITNKNNDKKNLEDKINIKNKEILKLNNEYEVTNNKLLDIKKEYTEIISFVKENVVVVKEYDTPPKPRNGKTIQNIINTNIPEKLKGKYKGYIVIELFINDKGIIQAIKDITSYPDNNFSVDIEEVCINEMQAIKWSPAIKDNKNIGVSYKVVFNFE